jgi:hypothetical protein
LQWNIYKDNMAQPIWDTTAGTIGTFPYGINVSFQFLASPVSPATNITYSLLAGILPTNLVIDVNGLLTGIPTLVTQDTTTSFTIRATDNLNNIRDRTFSITITGTAVPQFTTPSGVLVSTQDSIWTQLSIEYSNPDITNPVVIALQEGSLPPGLELSPTGLIQGYPLPPTINVTLPIVTTIGISTESSNDFIYCLNVAGMTPGRPVTFTDPIGDISAGVTYYIKTVDTIANTISISATQNGDTFPLSDATGAMTVTLPVISVGQPTIRTFNFKVRLLSPLGGNIGSYSITVINQNTPSSQGGPGNPPNTRIPTILNTRPLTIEINATDPYYGYYILPPVPPTQNAQIGSILSNNYFAFKMLGYDFDSNPLEYIFSNLPSWLTGNSETGWITGTPELSLPGINNYSFNVSVRKQGNPAISTTNFNFAFNLSKDVTGEIIWVTPSDLGTVYNGTISTLFVEAESDVTLNYRVISGSLPPNLELLSNGQITGFVADQPTSEFLTVGQNTEFTFTIDAFSPDYNIVSSPKTFTLNVLQQYGQPTDILYIQAAPSIQDRQILNTLLENTELIPDEALYRADDVYFGKATSVIYEHAYGIFASAIQDYIAAIQLKNHYWRNITLGELKTAVAKNAAGNIIYEVVYSEVIDNLVNSQGVSIEKSIFWPRPINLFLGPWYTSVTNIFTSWDVVLNQEYYTSLTPGFARTLYPNSLYNMRTQVADVLGQELDSSLLPLWMTSQQENGSTLGYTQAWVICYTKPGRANEIKNNIETNWPYTLNQINFQIDRFSVNKSSTYNWDNNLNPPAWTGLPSANPVPDPLNSKDFYVLFPRQTILPDNTQY